MSAPQPTTPPAEDRLSRLVALGAVVATLLAGLLAYLLVDASGKADNAGQSADRIGLKSMGELTRQMADAETHYEGLILAQQQRTHETLAFQEGLFLEGKERRGTTLARTRWAEVADRSERALPEDLLGKYGPQVDPAFPERYFASVTEEAVKLAALQDAANEVEGRYGEKVSKYIAIITMFGVALYLFALLSVSVQTDIKRLFAAVAAALLSTGTAWTAVVAFGQVVVPPDSAAEHFAKGHVALATAHDKAHYEEAIAHYDSAIDERPTFARAFFERAKAHYLSGSLQSSGTSVLSSEEALETPTSPKALNDATQDLEEALELGLATSPVLGQLGLNTLWQGLLHDSEELLDDSISYSHAAIALHEAEPVWHYNLGLALLAQGRYEEALEAYGAGIERTVYSDVGTKKPREDDALLELLEAEALTNLELLKRSGGEELDRRVEQIESRIVASVSAGMPANPGETASVSGMRLEVLPSEANLTAEATSGIGADDVVSAQLYYYDASHHAAYVIPEASGKLDGAGLRRGVELHYLSTTTPPRCLPDGRYRLDLYVNGRLVGRAFNTADFGDLHGAAAAPDLDLGTCVPHAWVHSDKSMPGLLLGHVRPDGSRGAFLFRFDVHDGTKHVQSREFADTAFDLALGHAAPPPAVSRPLSRGPFARLGDPMTLVYRLGPKAAETRVGIDDEGAVVVALVYGPADFVAGRQAAAILDSVFLYEPVVDDRHP